jgi:guanylate kinase
MLFDIDWQGTQQLKASMPSDVVSIFVLPPTHEELERRLKNRAQDTEEVVGARMARATDEISHYSEYDYIVVNDDVKTALAQVKSILEAERARRTRLIGVGEFVAGLTR